MSWFVFIYNNLILRSILMMKCCYSKKSDYWSRLAKKVQNMNEDQLITLYDVHKDFLFEPTMRDEKLVIKRYNSFKELTFNRLINHTWTTNYPALRQVVDLILTGYDYCRIVEIVFNCLPPWAREH